MTVGVHTLHIWPVFSLVPRLSWHASGTTVVYLMMPKINTALTDGARDFRGKETKYLTKAQAVLSRGSLSTLPTVDFILLRTPQKRERDPCPIQMYWARATLLWCSKWDEIDFLVAIRSLVPSHEMSMRLKSGHIWCVLTMGSWLHPFWIFNQFAPCQYIGVQRSFLLWAPDSGYFD